MRRYFYERFTNKPRLECAKSHNGSHKSWLNIVMGKIKIPNISDPKPNILEFYSDFFIFAS